VPPTFVQQTLTDEPDSPLTRSLRETLFVVVDLETTGGPAEECGITEIGAVKALGGEQLGEFATLVNPGQPIPPFITVLTGITQAMIAPAPPLTEVLPAFLEFAHGAVLVAHNAHMIWGSCAPPAPGTGTRGRTRRCSTPPRWPGRW
jgi:DNA polymerase-3 subunit epsilon